MQRGNITFIREQHTDKYTCISNKCLQDTRLTIGARGLIAQILSLPKTWTLYKAKLEEYNNNSRTSIKSALEELKKLGYLVEAKGSGQSITYIVNETPDGTVGIFDRPDAQNVHSTEESNVCFVQSDVQNVQEACTEYTSVDARNVQLLNKYKNNNKLTTTKTVSQSLLSNEELKESIEDTYSFVFSNDFYSNLSDLKEERGISPLEYVDWLINEKGKNADNLQNYVYKSAGNLNVINEYCRYVKIQKETRKELFKPAEVVICPECNHRFQSIDFITRKCECGLSLNEIMNRKGGCNE